MSENAAWSDDIVEMARKFHDIYEEEAKRFGWSSQTPVPFDKLPEANKQTMLCTIARATDWSEKRELAEARAEVERLRGIIERAVEATRQGTSAMSYYASGRLQLVVSALSESVRSTPLVSAASECEACEEGSNLTPPYVCPDHRRAREPVSACPTNHGRYLRWVLHLGGAKSGRMAEGVMYDSDFCSDCGVVLSESLP